jgi:hypothetical protein
VLRKLINPYPTLQLFFNYGKKYFDIAWKIQEVVRVLKVVIDFCRKILDRVFVWNVTDHKSRSWVITNVLWVNVEHIRIIVLYLFVYDVLIRG